MAGLEQLREPFPPNIVDKLPKGIDKSTPKQYCDICDGYHSRAAVHLDYVGHAAVTDRLLTVDPEWNWEPFAVTAHGAPHIIIRGNVAELWIRLTILGLTRIGVGTTSSDKDEASKELISDAIRNAAMRFGVALDLWAKSGLERSEGVTEQRNRVNPTPTPQPVDRGPVTPQTLKQQPPLVSVDKDPNPPNIMDMLRLNTPVQSAPKPFWQEFVKELVSADQYEAIGVPWRELTYGKGFDELTTLELKALVASVDKWLHSEDEA